MGLECPRWCRASPITYAVNGKHYVAVPVGTGGGGWASSIVTDTIPEARIPQATNSIFVCALPDAADKTARTIGHGHVVSARWDFAWYAEAANRTREPRTYELTNLRTYEPTNQQIES
jgi:hypothetical protein